MTYEELLKEADTQKLVVKEKDISGYSGRIYKNRIAIHKGLNTNIEKACVLAEELGHHYTTTGNILDQNIITNRKQEHRARVWAYRRAFGLTELISAYKYGCRNRYEIADYLNVTESFLVDAIDHYKAKHGLYAKVDSYLVYFEPLGVMELNIEK